MSWAGLRGAVPIVLATIPITVGLPAAHTIWLFVIERGSRGRDTNPSLR